MIAKRASLRPSWYQNKTNKSLLNQLGKSHPAIHLYLGIRYTRTQVSSSYEQKEEAARLAE